MIRALLFDLDGTLVDSEEQTDQSIAHVMAAHGFPGVRLPASETRGRSWPDVVAALRVRHAIGAAPAQIEEELLARWNALLAEVQPLPGAVAAVREAARYYSLAVVSSSPHAVIDRFLMQLGLNDAVAAGARIGSDNVKRHKPDPEGFLLAAWRLGASPADCVVFEDSVAGLQAARAASMRSVAVLHACAAPDQCRALADESVVHYASLPGDYWSSLSARFS
jgi:HAD superfamily hydrolase (TIGR01509 family)